MVASAYVRIEYHVFDAVKRLRRESPATNSIANYNIIENRKKACRRENSPVQWELQLQKSLGIMLFTWLSTHEDDSKCKGTVKKKQSSQS